MKTNFDGQETRERIEEILRGGTKHCTRDRSKALAGVQWFLATKDGRAVGPKDSTYGLVSIDKAEIYDGRDNEEMKRRYFEAVLKVPLMIVPVSEDVR